MYVDKLVREVVLNLILKPASFVPLVSRYNAVSALIVLLLPVMALLYPVCLLVSLLVSEIAGALMIAYIVREYYTDRIPDTAGQQLWLNLIKWVHDSTGIINILPYT